MRENFEKQILNFEHSFKNEENFQKEECCRNLTVIRLFYHSAKFSPDQMTSLLQLILLRVPEVPCFELKNNFSFFNFFKFSHCFTYKEQ